MSARVTQSAEWRFFGALKRSEPALTTAWWVLVLIRGTLPAVFAVATGAVVARVNGGAPLGAALALAGATFVSMSAIGPIHDAVSANLGSRASIWLHDRLMHACVDPPGLAHLEDPALADDLGYSRDFDLGISGPPVAACVPQIAMGFAQVFSGVAQTLLLATWRWWAALVLAAAWAATHVLLKESAVWKAYESDPVVAEQRHVNYAYRLAVDAPAAKELRLFGLGDWAVRRFTDRRRKLVDLLFHQRRLRQRPMGASVAIVIVANVLVFGVLARDATSGRVGLGALVVFAQAAIGVSLVAFGEFDWWFRTGAQPFPKVLDLAQRMLPKGRLASTGSASADGLPVRDIQLEGVHFAYAADERPVLHGFDLTIRAGRSLAIVGQNGAGKTTLAKLICRMYDPQSGAIRVDGIDVRELDVDSWRSRVAAVFQDFVRYELPLRDNVAPGGAPDPDVMLALDAAGATGLADLDTVLSRAYRGGTDLSGGQWQRVALARAVCSVRLGASVIILDEPTAHLDVRGEAEIFDRILEASRGLTTILISHRFSTVRHADRIVVLEYGRVVEEGSHDELIAHGGRYRTMFDLQASRFEEEEDVEQL